MSSLIVIKDVLLTYYILQCVVIGVPVCPAADNADVSRQMEEAESRASQLSRSKTLLQSQLEELKKQLDEEVKVSVCVCLCGCVCVCKIKYPL